VVYLPQEGNQKVGIDDYLLGHSLEEAQKLATDFRVEDIESRERFVPGLFCTTVPSANWWSAKKMNVPLSSWSMAQYARFSATKHRSHLPPV